MKLWRKAAGLLKDQNSIWAANFSKRSPIQNPDIDEAVIKATSHNENRIDYRNSQRVFAWVRMSPSYLKPLIWSITVRMEKTRSWVVALKGLMLVHGVFCCKVPAVQKIGRLPFDLSNFKDSYSNKTWAHDAFIRAYYAFLDQKSTFIYLHSQELKALHKGVTELEQQRQQALAQELVWLQNLQKLLDMLLQIRPQSEEMIGVLILEAMDCIVIEIMDIYSRICNGISRILMKIYSSGKDEAAIMLKILRKATVQGDELASYFEFCKEIGVINASESPTIDQIPEEDIRELENIINGVSYKCADVKYPVLEEDKEAITVKMIQSSSHHERKDSTSSLCTIITDEWEVFEESPKKANLQKEDPFAAALISLSPPPAYRKVDELPDLITF